MRILGLGLISLWVFVPPTAWAAEPSGPYLSEQLNKSVYNETFNALLKGQDAIEPWLQGYLEDRNGVEYPGERRVVGGKMVELYEVCRPHNCPGNVIYVVFEPGGTRAWALFTKDDGTSRFFGNPDEQMQAALRANVHWP